MAAGLERAIPKGYTDEVNDIGDDDEDDWRRYIGTEGVNLFRFYSNF